MNDALEPYRRTLLAAIDNARQAMSRSFSGSPRPDAPLDEISGGLRSVAEPFMFKMEIERAGSMLQRQLTRSGLSTETVRAIQAASEACESIQHEILADIGAVLIPADLFGDPDSQGAIHLGPSAEAKLKAIESVTGHPMYSGDYPSFATQCTYSLGLHDGLFPTAARRVFTDVTTAMLQELPIDRAQLVIARRVTRVSIASPWGVLLERHDLEYNTFTDPIIFPPDLCWILCLDHGGNGIFAERDRALLLK
jgi:hypothetical protein